MTSDNSNTVAHFYITVRFETAEGRQMVLEGSVSEDIYNTCAPQPGGSPIDVRYADEDPTVALFEGEY